MIAAADSPGVWQVLERGGPVMWPLLVMSVVAVALVIERAWSLRPGGGIARRAAGLTEGGAAGGVPSKAGGQAARLAVDAVRTSAERFLPTLSAVITAAPLLGVLGTVLGIIDSFEVLSGSGGAAVEVDGDRAAARSPEPASVGAGIAAALVSTAAGLIVALVVLFPYQWLRGRAEALVRMAAARAGVSSAGTGADVPEEAA